MFPTHRLTGHRLSVHTACSKEPRGIFRCQDGLMRPLFRLTPSRASPANLRGAPSLPPTAAVAVAAAVVHAGGTGLQKRPIRADTPVAAAPGVAAVAAVLRCTCPSRQAHSTAPRRPGGRPRPRHCRRKKQSERTPKHVGRYAQPGRGGVGEAPAHQKRYSHTDLRAGSHRHCGRSGGRHRDTTPVAVRFRRSPSRPRCCSVPRTPSRMEDASRWAGKTPPP